MSSDAVKEMSHIFKTKSFVKTYSLAEKISGPFTEALVDQTGIASYSNPPIILDNASGTGIVCSILNTKTSEQVRQGWELTAGDFSEAMVEYAAQRAKEEGWINASAKVVDAQDTKLPSGHYTHVFATFAFQAIPNHNAALKESFRILKPGGMIALATWKHVPWITLVKHAITTISPDLYYPDSDDFIKTMGQGWEVEASIGSLLRDEGFMDIHISLAILPALLAKYWTQQQRDVYAEQVSGALQQYLEREYGVDALVPLEPVALIATARKPE